MIGRVEVAEKKVVEMGKGWKWFFFLLGRLYEVGFVGVLSKVVEADGCV